MKPITTSQAVKQHKRPSRLGEGRPSKLTPELALKIFMLSRKGLTDKEIANVFDITEQTINNWKKDPEFFESLKADKKIADLMVERSLFERAIGYEHKETELFCHRGKVISKEITKHYPPDPTSMIFWLKNRLPKEWRDKSQVDQGFTDETDALLQKYKHMSAQELVDKVHELTDTICRQNHPRVQ